MGRGRKKKYDRNDVNWKALAIEAVVNLIVGLVLILIDKLIS